VDYINPTTKQAFKEISSSDQQGKWINAQTDSFPPNPSIHKQQSVSKVKGGEFTGVY